MIVFDIESDGLLDTISKLHCINALDRATGREYRFTDHEYYQDVEGNTTDRKCPRDGDIKDALDILEKAPKIAGHNIHGYDVPALQILYPEFKVSGRQIDSRTMGETLYPDIKDKDWSMIRKGKLPETFAKGDGRHGRHVGSHSLSAWGARLKAMGYDVNTKTDFNPKDYGHTWETMPFTQEMDDYCMDDVRANVALFEFFGKKDVDQRSVTLEQRVSEIIRWQERVGIRFDELKAEHLAAILYKEQARLREECQDVFEPFYKKDGKEKTFKRSMKRTVNLSPNVYHAPGLVKEWISEGAVAQPVELVAFNPGSNQHVERCLRVKYGWEPTELTETGLAKIDEDVLGTLPFPEAQKIAEFRTVNKRLSQLCEGKQAWMKKVKKDGRIYGRVNQNGCVTGRMSHFGPNLGQVPQAGKPYGAECRSLFVADDGRVIVGCDADALELRILAHFMASFDGGAYVDVVLNGSKEEGTDMHTRNQHSIGLRLRNSAKTFFYALLYGAGPYKLGTTILADWEADKLTRFYTKYPPGNRRKAKIVSIGNRGRDGLMAGLPALGQLVDQVQRAAKRGYLKGLDGRRIPIRSMHAALNSLCQSAGAVVMKQALVEMFREYEARNIDVIPLLNVHDEVQLSVLPEDAEDVGRIAAQSITRAGEIFGLRCPLAGDYAIGHSWAETH